MKFFKRLYLAMNTCDGMCNHCKGKLKEYCVELKTNTKYVK
jgi:hypothetical protein